MATTSVSVDTYVKFNLGYSDFGKNYYDGYHGHVKDDYCDENLHAYGMHVEDLKEHIEMLSDLFDE